MTIRPAAVEEPIPSVVDTSRTPRSVRSLTFPRMWSVLRPSRSNFHTAPVSSSMNRKSLFSKGLSGAPSGFRTPDPLIKSQLLYQLS